ncbi:hypothetical protein Tco_0762494 [Tanacetum coccineum]
MEFLDFLTRPRLRVRWTLRSPATSGSKHLEGNFHREGFNPATGSPTATLLRLHPSRRPHRGETYSQGVMGGVYRARVHIHRGTLIRDSNFMFPSCREQSELRQSFWIRSALQTCFPL